jgi:hypothetical protein
VHVYIVLSGPVVMGSYGVQASWGRQVQRVARSQTWMLLYLGFKALEQRESICCRPCKASYHFVPDLSSFSHIWLYHCPAHRHLAVGHEHHLKSIEYTRYMARPMRAVAGA